jgi:hypothetical protein
MPTLDLPLKKVGKLVFIVILICIFTVCIGLGIKYTVQELWITDRAQHALEITTLKYSPDYYVTFTPIVTKYFNKFYNEDMDLKLCDFYIAASYKSYLPAGSTFDVFSYNAIVNCLTKGARFIHLDIFSDGLTSFDTSANPIVRNDTLMPYYGKPLDFRKCCKVINDTAWQNNTYPLLLFLNIDAVAAKNASVIDKMANILLTEFQNHLMDKKYGFQRSNISQISIKDLTNQVIILTNSYPNGGTLDELTNAVIPATGGFVNNFELKQSMIAYGLMSAAVTDSDSMINFNKNNMTRVFMPSERLNSNLYDPKIDIMNFDATSAWNLGCQLVCQNYQIYDDSMKINIAMFKTCPFVMKPDKLREIPQPPYVPKVQNTKVYFGANASEDPGWYKFNH